MNVRQAFNEVFEVALSGAKGSPASVALTRSLAHLSALAAKRSGETPSDQSEQLKDLSFVHRMALELLQYSIEGEAIDLRDEASKIISAFREYFESGSELALYEVSKRIQEKSPLPVQSVILRVGDNGVGVRARLSKSADNLIPVSTSFFPVVPILEETVADPTLGPGLCLAVASVIHDLVLDSVNTSLCFIEKSVGPVGALSLLSSLVTFTGLPAIVYRPKYLANRGKLSGCTDPVKKRTILVYDLFVTGTALMEAAIELRELYNIEVVGAVVVMNFSLIRELQNESVSFPVASIMDYLSVKDEIMRYYKSGVEFSENIVFSTAGRIQESASVGDWSARPQSRGPMIMNFDKSDDQKSRVAERSLLRKQDSGEYRNGGTVADLTENVDLAESLLGEILLLQENDDLRQEMGVRLGLIAKEKS